MGESGPDIIRTDYEICKGRWSPAGDGGIMTYKSLTKPPLSHIPTVSQTNSNVLMTSQCTRRAKT